MGFYYLSVSVEKLISDQREVTGSYLSRFNSSANRTQDGLTRSCSLCGHSLIAIESYRERDREKEAEREREADRGREREREQQRQQADRQREQQSADRQRQKERESNKDREIEGDG